MSELDLLDLSRSATQNEITDFIQVIAINFAMVVAIFYFLHQARIMMKLFAFVVYSTGMALFLGEALLETNLKAAALTSLAAIPQTTRSHVVDVYLAVNASWLATTTSVVFNFAFWVLWIGVFALLFFWKREAVRSA